MVPGHGLHLGRTREGLLLTPADGEEGAVREAHGSEVAAAAPWKAGLQALHPCRQQLPAFRLAGRVLEVGTLST